MSALQGGSRWRERGTDLKVNMAGKPDMNPRMF